MPVSQGTQSIAVAGELESVFAIQDGLPEVVSCVRSVDVFDICLDTQAELIWFPGHFPGTPVLPGIVQLHWAAIAAACLYGFDGAPQAINRLKFKKVVVPPRKLYLRLKVGKPGEIQFTFTSGQHQHSLGTLLFSTADSC